MRENKVGTERWGRGGREGRGREKMKRKVIWVELMNHLINKICHKQKINKHTNKREVLSRSI
jgi:hypothetical protein